MGIQKEGGFVGRMVVIGMKEPEGQRASDNWL